MLALTLLAMSASFLTASAQVAVADPVELSKRSAYAGGGWAYNVGSGNCPLGTTSFGDVSIDVCCPNGFENEGSAGPAARVCCPKGNSCLTALQALPFCADSSWILWNATTQDPGHQYFCCLQGQIGLQDESCVSEATNVVATQSAVKVGQPVPTGPAGVTISVSAGSAGSASTTTAAKGSVSSDSTTTTGKGGLGGLLSSVVAGATSHSDSTRVQPIGADLPRLGMLGLGSGIAGIVAIVALMARIG